MIDIIFHHHCYFVCYIPIKQARKSSEDAQAAGYAQFENFLGWVTFGSKKFGPKILAYLQYTFKNYTFGKYTFGKHTYAENKLSEKTHTHTHTHTSGGNLLKK